MEDFLEGLLTTGRHHAFRIHFTRGRLSSTGITGLRRLTATEHQEHQGQGYPRGRGPQGINRAIARLIENRIR